MVYGDPDTVVIGISNRCLCSGESLFCCPLVELKCTVWVGGNAMAIIMCATQPVECRRVPLFGRLFYCRYRPLVVAGLVGGDGLLERSRCRYRCAEKHEDQRGEQQCAANSWFRLRGDPATQQRAYPAGPFMAGTSGPDGRRRPHARGRRAEPASARVELRRPGRSHARAHSRCRVTGPLSSAARAGGEAVGLHLHLHVQSVTWTLTASSLQGNLSVPTGCGLPPGLQRSAAILCRLPHPAGMTP